MKPALLALAHDPSIARKQHSQILAGILLIGWNGRIAATDERVVTNEEMRTVLLETDEEFRSQAIWNLEHWSKDKTTSWPKEALVFLKEVWPKQVAAKSAGVSARLAELAFSRDDDFTDYVDAVLPLIIPIDRDHMRLPANVVEKYPKKTLELLDAILPDDARKWPYGMDDLLRRIGLVDPSLVGDAQLVSLNRTWNAR